MIAMTPFPKELEAKYELLGALRSGGMGAVYRVRHRFLDEIQVVKVMHAALAGSEDLRARFVREAKTAKQLRHPNIAEVIDFSVTADGVAYIVMEFIQGVDLRDVLRRAGKPLDWPLVAEIGMQTCGVLSFLHGRGFIHRDISPDNLMLTRSDDGAPHVKLIDLGIAKAVTGAASLDLTRGGNFIGKVQYASPEQFGGSDGTAAVDHRSDLYSLGVVLYEILTDMEPIVGSDYKAIIAGHLTRPPREFATADPGGRVPGWMRAVVMRALQKEPKDRFQSANEFAGAIRRGLTSTVQVPPPAPPSAAVADPDATVMMPWDEELPAARTAVDALDETIAAGLSQHDLEERAWTRALAVSTAEGWAEYLKNFPHAARSTEARRYFVAASPRTQDQHERMWQELVRRRDIVAVQTFMRTYPQSPRAADARTLIETILRDERESAAARERAKNTLPDTRKPAAAAETFPDTVMEKQGKKTAPATKPTRWRMPMLALSASAGFVLLIGGGAALMLSRRELLPAPPVVAPLTASQEPVAPAAAIPAAPQLLLGETIGPLMLAGPAAATTVADAEKDAEIPRPKSRQPPRPQPAVVADPVPAPVADLVALETIAPATPAPAVEAVSFVEGGDAALNRKAIAFLRAHLQGVTRFRIHGSGDVEQLISILRRSARGKSFSPDEGDVTIVYASSHERLGKISKRRAAEAAISKNGAVIFRYQLQPEVYRIGDTPAEAFARVLRKAVQ